jgi:hypothetical protein
VSAARQQHLAVQPVDRAERGLFAQRVVESVSLGDRGGVLAERGEGGLGVVAADRAGPGTDRLGEHAGLASARGQSRLPPGAAAGAGQQRSSRTGCELGGERPPAAMPHSGVDVLTWNGETLTLIGWSQRTGIRVETLLRRCRNGWSVEQVLTTPPGEGRVATPPA